MFCIVMEYFGVEDVIVFFGLNINGFINSLSLGVLFVMLIDFDKRMMFDLFGGVIVVQFNQNFGFIKGVFVVIFLLLLVMGLGMIGGFCLQVEDRGNLGFEEFECVM